MSDDGTRFQIEFCAGGENPMWGFRVRDMEDDETYGYGLTYDHAFKLAVDLAGAAGINPWRRHTDAPDA
jgi:hypothetical protein